MVVQWYPDLWWYYILVIAVGSYALLWILSKIPIGGREELVLPEREPEPEQKLPVPYFAQQAVKEDREIRLSPYPYRMNYPPFNTTLSPMRKPLTGGYSREQEQP